LLDCKKRMHLPNYETKRSFCIAHKHDWNRCGPLQPEKILFQNRYIENTKPKAWIRNHQSPIPSKKTNGTQLPIEKKPIPSKDINNWTYHLTKGPWKDSHNVEPIMSPHNSKNKMLFYLVYPTPRPTLARKKGLGKFLKPDHFTTYVFSKWVIIQWNFQNSWSPILEIEISCQWEGSACTWSALIFSFKFWGGAGEDFFHFPFAPIMFLSSSHWVAHVFPKSVLCLQNSAPALTYVKNGDKQFWKKKFHEPMGRLSIHSWTIQFVFRWVGGGREGEGLFVFFPGFRSVPIMFPSNSQTVPDAFPTLFPIAPGFCAI